MSSAFQPTGQQPIGGRETIPAPAEAGDDGGLRESEERFRLAAWSLRGIVYDWDVPTRRVQRSGNLNGVLGYCTGEDEPVDGWWLSRVHPEDLPRVQAEQEAAWTNAVPDVDAEYRVRHRDGHYVWVWDHGVLVRDAHGRVVRVVGSTFDITDRKRVEEALRKSEALFTAAFHSNPVPMAILTLDGRYVEANQAMLEHSGYTREQMIGRTTADLQFFADATQRADYYRVLKQSGGVRGFAAQLRVASGEIRDCILSAERMELDGQDCILAVRVDVTDRKRTEARLRESELRFRTLADAMPQLVWTAQPDGVVDYYNARREAYGAIGDDPRDWQLILHPDDLAPTWEAWRRANTARAPYEMEHRIRMTDGNYRWHLSRALPVCDAAGEVIKWYGTATDIEARKRAESSLAESEARHRALAEALRDADRRKDDFLAMLAHELRNPLSPIRNGIELLRLRTSDAEIQGVTAMIARQVNHLVRLVDDLLDVSRVTQGKVALKREALDVAGIVNEAVELAREILLSKRHELVAALPQPGELKVDGDAVRLAQVVGNLLNNAAKYTNAGGRIELSARADAGEVVVTVRDNGIGIDAHLLPHVFELFTQGQCSLDRAQGGLGIGLALVKTLVLLHGGSVHATSEGAGQGSLFTVRLPRLLEVPAASNEDGTATAEASPRSVLIVDDNVDAAHSLGMLLDLAGHRVAYAYDGKGALDSLVRQHPDVVLLDIGLPGMDGYAVARRVREECLGKQPVLVALTGYGQAEDHHFAREAGFDHHLVKPVEPSRLMALLTSAASKP
jgi:PAS domain S-box-containing protein